MMFQPTSLLGIASCLSLGAALMLSSTAFGEELAGPPLPSSIPDAVSAVSAATAPPAAMNPPEKPRNDLPATFVGPPAPPDAMRAIGAELVGPSLPPPAPDTPNAFDTPRNYLSGKFVDFVSYIDRFFGNDRNYQEANDSVMQLDIVRVAGYRGEPRFVWSARANVRLPMAEKKLHLIVETAPDKNAVVDPTQTQSPPLKQPSTPQSYAAALRIERKEAERWHLNADAGIKFHGLIRAPTPFVRSRASLAVPLEQWRTRLSETVFWFNTTGIGETTQFDLERPLSEPVLFRATTIVAWLKNTHYYDMRQDLSVYHKLDDRTALLYQITAVGVSSPHTQVNDYILLVLYRYRIHRNWMFLELSPQLHFPKDKNYRSSPMFSMRLEMLFDETR
jgi:hypothetical protein